MILSLALILVGLNPAPTVQPSLLAAMQDASRAALEQTMKSIPENLRVKGDAPIHVDTLSFRQVAAKAGLDAGPLQALSEIFGARGKSLSAKEAVACESLKCQVRDNGAVVSLQSVVSRKEALTLVIRTQYTARRPSGSSAVGFQDYKVTMIEEKGRYVVSGVELGALS